MSFGNRLLGVTLGLLGVALVTGATGIMEHPAEDDASPMTVSVWRTFVTRTLSLFPRCVKLRVLQGHVGASAVEPTDLLRVNITEHAEQILLAARSTDLPKRGVIPIANST